MFDPPPVRGSIRPAVLPIWLRIQKKTTWRYLTALLERMRPARDFHAFGVGLPRTGTLSLAKMLSANYRAEHEPETWILTHIFKQSTLGYGQNLSKKEKNNILKSRDNILGLSMESSHVLGLIIEDIYEIFDDCKYILTIRDCYSWINSMINRRKDTGYVQPWNILADCRYGERRFYHEKERKLKDLGLYPIGNYFSYWSDHISLVTNTIPEESLLIIRTRNLSKRKKDISDFLKIPHDTIGDKQDHLHKRRDKEYKITEIVDEGFVESVAEFYCTKNMERFYDGL